MQIGRNDVVFDDTMHFIVSSDNHRFEGNFNAVKTCRDSDGSKVVAIAFFVRNNDAGEDTMGPKGETFRIYNVLPDRVVIHEWANMNILNNYDFADSTWRAMYGCAPHPDYATYQHSKSMVFK